MGNGYFKLQHQDQKYNHKSIVFLRSKKSMEDVREAIEYLKDYYPTHYQYDLEQFTDVFQSYFEDYTEEYFALLENNKNPEGKIDVYEAIALMCIINNDEFDTRLNYLFRLFDFNQSETLELNEFVMTIQTAFKGLCKAVNIKPPHPNDIERFAENFFNQADEDHNGTINLKEFVSFAKNNWELQDWFLKYADLNTFENTDRRHKEKFGQYIKIFPGQKEIQTVEDEFSKEVEITFIQQAIKQIIKDNKGDTVNLLMSMLEQTSKYINPKVGKGNINYAAFYQVIKAWSAFDACDINGDDSIDATELEFLLYAIEGDKPSKYRIEKELRNMDTDCSGNISRKEWIEYLCVDPENSGKMVFRDGLRSLFNQFDTDNSGSLERSELRALLQKNLQVYKFRWERQQTINSEMGKFDVVIEQIIEDMMLELQKQLRIPSDQELVVKWQDFKLFMEESMTRQNKLKEFLDSYA